MNSHKEVLIPEKNPETQNPATRFWGKIIKVWGTFSGVSGTIHLILGAAQELIRAQQGELLKFITNQAVLYPEVAHNPFRYIPPIIPEAQDIGNIAVGLSGILIGAMFFTSGKHIETQGTNLTPDRC